MSYRRLDCRVRSRFKLLVEVNGMSRWLICIMRMVNQRQVMLGLGIQDMVGIINIMDMGVMEGMQVHMLEDMETSMEDTLVLLGHTHLLSII